MSKSDETRLRAHGVLVKAEETLAKLKKEQLSKQNKENATIAGTKWKKVHVALARLALAEKCIKPTQANIADELGVDIKTLRKIIKEE